MSVHDGHRKRLKQRFLTEGLDECTDVQVLELLLFYCIHDILCTISQKFSQIMYFESEQKLIKVISAHIFNQ